MPEKFYSSTDSDPYFLQLKDMLMPLVEDVRGKIPGASRKAIWIMCEIVANVPPSLHKDPKYTNEVIEAVRLYVSVNDPKIKSFARSRKTDRLRILSAITSDFTEYLSFLPLRLERDSYNIHRYIENVDDAIWILRNIKPNTNWLQMVEEFILQA